MTHRETPIKLTIDTDADAAYVSMSERVVTQSLELGGGIIVDFDDMYVVVGIEILGLDTQIPLQRLIDDFYVHSDDVAILRSIQSSINGFLLQVGTDGSSHNKAMEGSLLTLA